MDLSYYLPEIVLGIIAAAALIWGVCFTREMFLFSKGKVTCVHCRKTTSKDSSKKYLFLLPISFGQKYEDAEHYLPSHMTPIPGTDWIPTGRRACWVELYACSRCGRELVTVTDFLLVRDTEDVKAEYVLSAGPFLSLIDSWEALAKRGAYQQEPAFDTVERERSYIKR